MTAAFNLALLRFSNFEKKPARLPSGHASFRNTYLPIMVIPLRFAERREGINAYGAIGGHCGRGDGDRQQQRDCR